MDFSAFIENQFPVSKLSKESYKERKANNSQTLTGLGKWWGRKPLVLVRATIIGMLLPATDDPEKDLDVFLKLMTMDEEGLRRRRNKSLSAANVADALGSPDADRYVIEKEEKWHWRPELSREERAAAQEEAFSRLGYDEKLRYCLRPEQIDGPSPEAWEVINTHCGTNAKSLQEWVQQMGERQFGHAPKVGDAFCGGGSIPFEAARLGCEAYGSDLNPVAALLTWAALNIIGGGKKFQNKIREAQRKAFEAADQQITKWGIEHNEKGWRADAYLYCTEAKSPATGYWVPLAPNWVISEKFGVCAVLKPDHENRRYHIEIITDADKGTLEKSKIGTVQNSRLICPETGQEFPISTIRGDLTIKGETIYGLRMWENEDLLPRPNDTFQERLYCIRYLDQDGNQHYVKPTEADFDREGKVLELLKERFEEWQKKGYIPSGKIPEGDKTEEPKRTRGWTHWHHLFNPRHLLVNGILIFKSEFLQDKSVFPYLLLGAAKLANWNSRLIQFGVGGSKSSFSQSFSNQALNSLYNGGAKGISYTEGSFCFPINIESLFQNTSWDVSTSDARTLEEACTFWITDPPYADAINYHEIADFFLAWYEKHLPKLFPEWYADSRSALAVKGKGQSFNRSMVEVYSNLTAHMPDNGAQVVMFTHQDAGVWADLALILWASGLRVTAAWTIQTETDAGGIKKGNYVQGTVLMVLRKQTSHEVGFLTDIQSEVEFGVKKQIDFMRQLDDKEDPNFGDADYQLAAYAAALRVLTSYQRIGDIDVEYELGKERKPGEPNEIEKIIESAVGVAMDYLVPTGIEERHWRKLQPEERFYLKGLEVEQSGEYRSGVYTEMARGYGLREYSYLLNTSKANGTRLKTALEFQNRELGGDGFGKSLTRQMLFAIREAYRTENPAEGRNWLYSEWPAYWNDRQLIIHLLDYLIVKCGHIGHWRADVEAATLLKGYLENDTMI